jgi:hypothetical protein
MDAVAGPLLQILVTMCTGLGQTLPEMAISTVGSLGRIDFLNPKNYSPAPHVATFAVKHKRTFAKSVCRIQKVEVIRCRLGSR